MTKPRFSEQQVAVALRQAEQGTPAVGVCRRLGVSEATFYAWKKRYVGMGVAELHRVRQLEDGNRRLKADLRRSRPAVRNRTVVNSRETRKEAPAQPSPSSLHPAARLQLHAPLK